MKVILIHKIILFCYVTVTDSKGLWHFLDRKIYCHAKTFCPPIPNMFLQLCIWVNSGKIYMMERAYEFSKL